MEKMGVEKFSKRFLSNSELKLKLKLIFNVLICDLYHKSFTIVKRDSKYGRNGLSKFWTLENLDGKNGL